MSVKVTHRPRYKGVLKNYEKSARKVVAYALQETRAIAVQGILSGNKSGATYTRGGASHTASAAGEYPANDTGYLASNINVQPSTTGLSGSVESRANYSAHLEFGTSKMAARPFMQPSAEQVRPKLRRRIKEFF
jgi:HK97 gp10 family phage protein